jgi:hypothetical protein
MYNKAHKDTQFWAYNQRIFTRNYAAIQLRHMKKNIKNKQNILRFLPYISLFACCCCCCFPSFFILIRFYYYFIILLVFISSHCVSHLPIHPFIFSLSFECFHDFLFSFMSSTSVAIRTPYVHIILKKKFIKKKTLSAEVLYSYSSLHNSPMAWNGTARQSKATREF